MEAVGLTASILQIISGIIKAAKYINDVKHAPKERSELAVETTSLIPLLTDLMYRVESSNSTDTWFEGVRALEGDNGPLDQFNRSMNELIRKLEPTTAMKALGKNLVWTLSKKDIIGILAKIERLKTVINLTLQNDQLLVPINHQVCYYTLNQPSTLALATNEQVLGIKHTVLEIKDGKSYHLHG